MLCCGYTLTDFPISIRLTSLALWQSNDCPSASKATLMNMDKYFMWIHYEQLHNHNKAKHNKTVCIFLGIYCTYVDRNDVYHALLFDKDNSNAECPYSENDCRNKMITQLAIMVAWWPGYMESGLYRVLFIESSISKSLNQNKWCPVATGFYPKYSGLVATMHSRIRVEYDQYPAPSVWK